MECTEKKHAATEECEKHNKKHTHTHTLNAMRMLTVPRTLIVKRRSENGFFVLFITIYEVSPSERFK